MKTHNPSLAANRYFHAPGTNTRHFIYGISFFCILFLFSCKKDLTSQVSIASDVVTTPQQFISGKPNIILIIMNDFGFEIPTYNGGQSYSTPELDNIDATGMYFQQAYNHPDGTPSRLAILTGKYNFRNYVKWGLLPWKDKTVGNMLHDAGYATCWVGKWQLRGEDQRIRGAGFDNYLVFLPSGYDQRNRRYKNPLLYQNAAYLPDSVTNGKFSEDMLYNYLSNFIDSNKNNSFFAVYATLLPAQPWVATPDDPEYANWTSHDDSLNQKKYFPDMVSYLDKNIGKIRKKLEDAGIAQNTVIMITSATQTDGKISSQWKGQTIKGTKTNTVKYGTNMPLLVYWPGTVSQGSVSPALVDFTDFLPTIADIANVPKPTTWGTLDGTTFYDNMINSPVKKDRSWVFCHWDNNPATDAVPPERFINDTTYKLYDTVGVGNGRFYNISIDPWELNPIPDGSLTSKELQRKKYFRSILDTMHK